MSVIRLLLVSLQGDGPLGADLIPCGSHDIRPFLAGLSLLCKQAACGLSQAAGVFNGGAGEKRKFWKWREEISKIQQDDKGAVMKNSEKRLKQISRMVDILGLLNKEKGGYSRQELAEKFEVDIRSISRDISTLAKEFPLHCDSETRKYRFSDGYSFKDIDLSPEEIRALLMCTLIASNIGEPLSNAMDSLMKKLKVELGQTSRKIMEKVSTSYSFNGEQLEDISVSSSQLEAIQEAIERNTSLVINYANGKDESVKMIDPYGLFFRVGMSYVVVHDHADEEINILPLARIKTVRKTSNIYSIPSDFSVDDFIKANPDKVNKEDLKELQDMLEWIDCLYTLKELTSIKAYVDAMRALLERLNEEIRKIQTTINERNIEIRRLEQMKNEQKRIDSQLYEDLKALNKIDMIVIEQHIQSKDIYKFNLKREVHWDNRDNISEREVETILKEAVKRMNRISVNEEFKRSVSDLDSGEISSRKQEIIKEIEKLKGQIVKR